MNQRLHLAATKNQTSKGFTVLAHGKHYMPILMKDFTFND